MLSYYALHCADLQRHNNCPASKIPASKYLKPESFLQQNWAPEPWGGSVCPTWLQHKLLGDWIARKWAAPLTLTPCDLWQFLAAAGSHPGRTLWLIGDSQVCGSSSWDSHIALQALLCTHSSGCLLCR